MASHSLVNAPHSQSTMLFSIHKKESIRASMNNTTAQLVNVPSNNDPGAALSLRQIHLK
jgi:hypothetical protein